MNALVAELVSSVAECDTFASYDTQLALSEAQQPQNLFPDELRGALFGFGCSDGGLSQPSNTSSKTTRRSSKRARVVCYETLLKESVHLRGRFRDTPAKLRYGATLTNCSEHNMHAGGSSKNAMQDDAMSIEESFLAKVIEYRRSQAVHESTADRLVSLGRKLLFTSDESDSNATNPSFIHQCIKLLLLLSPPVEEIHESDAKTAVEGIRAHLFSGIHAPLSNSAITPPRYHVNSAITITPIHPPEASSLQALQNNIRSLLFGDVAADTPTRDTSPINSVETADERVENAEHSDEEDNNTNMYAVVEAMIRSILQACSSCLHQPVNVHTQPGRISSCVTVLKRNVAMLRQQNVSTMLDVGMLRQQDVSTMLHSADTHCSVDFSSVSRLLEQLLNSLFNSLTSVCELIQSVRMSRTYVACGKDIPPLARIMVWLDRWADMLDVVNAAMSQPANLRDFIDNVRVLLYDVEKFHAVESVEYGTPFAVLCEPPSLREFMGRLLSELLEIEVKHDASRLLLLDVSADLGVQGSNDDLGLWLKQVAPTLAIAIATPPQSMECLPKDDAAFVRVHGSVCGQDSRVEEQLAAWVVSVLTFEISHSLQAGRSMRLCLSDCYRCQLKWMQWFYTTQTRLAANINKYVLSCCSNKLRCTHTDIPASMATADIPVNLDTTMHLSVEESYKQLEYQRLRAAKSEAEKLREKQEEANTLAKEQLLAELLEAIATKEREIQLIAADDTADDTTLASNSGASNVSLPRKAFDSELISEAKRELLSRYGAAFRRVDDNLPSDIADEEVALRVLKDIGSEALLSVEKFHHRVTQPPGGVSTLADVLTPRRGSNVEDRSDSNRSTRDVSLQQDDLALKTHVIVSQPSGGVSVMQDILYEAKQAHTTPNASTSTPRTTVHVSQPSGGDSVMQDILYGGSQTTSPAAVTSPKTQVVVTQPSGGTSTMQDILYGGGYTESTRDAASKKTSVTVSQPSGGVSTMQDILYGGVAATGMDAHDGIADNHMGSSVPSKLRESVSVPSESENAVFGQSNVTSAKEAVAAPSGPDTDYTHEVTNTIDISEHYEDTVSTTEVVKNLASELLSAAVTQPENDVELLPQDTNSSQPQKQQTTSSSSSLLSINQGRFFRLPQQEVEIHACDAQLGAAFYIHRLVDLPLHRREKLLERARLLACVCKYHLFEHLTSLKLWMLLSEGNVFSVFFERLFPDSFTFDGSQMSVYGKISQMGFDGKLSQSWDTYAPENASAIFASVLQHTGMAEEKQAYAFETMHRYGAMLRSIASNDDVSTGNANSVTMEMLVDVLRTSATVRRVKPAVMHAHCFTYASFDEDDASLKAFSSKGWMAEFADALQPVYNHAESLVSTHNTAISTGHPLDCVFTPDAYKRYTTLHRFVLRLKRVSFELRRLWRALMSLPRRNSWNPAVTQACVFRRHAATFIDALESYVHVDVIESAFTELCRRISSVETCSISDVTRIHNDYLCTLLHKCLQPDPCSTPATATAAEMRHHNAVSAATKLLDALLTSLLDFCHTFYSNNPSLTTAEDYAALANTLRSKYATFQRYHDTVMRVIEQMSDWGAGFSFVDAFLARVGRPTHAF